MVDFTGSYHAILGRPCYAKFMAILNYTYLKLNMPGPHGVITVGTSFKEAYKCERANCDLAASLVVSKELANPQKIQGRMQCLRDRGGREGDTARPH